MAIPELLGNLLVAPGPSGHEAKAAKVWRDWCHTFTSDVEVDVNGSSWARLAGNAPGLSLAVIGHIDEIGVHITHIDDDGFLRFGNVGGWDPINLVSQRVAIETREGTVYGVIGRKAIHLMDPEDRKQVPELKSLHIDIGAATGDEARKRVRIGDVGVLDAQPIELPNGRVVSRSLDNRVGCYVAARTGQLIVEGGGRDGDYLGLAVVQEETGLRGAAMSAFKLRPDVAIAVDVTHASDTPGIALGPDTAHKLGSGPVIERSTMLHPVISELLYDTAVEEKIPFTVSSSARSTATDADSFAFSRSGIPTGLVSVPLRYMHSSVETVEIEDIENTARLLAAFARKLGPGTSLAR
jgi:putative aminopeptidase FrvX